MAGALSSPMSRTRKRTTKNTSNDDDTRKQQASLQQTKQMALRKRYSKTRLGERSLLFLTLALLVFFCWVCFSVRSPRNEAGVSFLRTPSFLFQNDDPCNGNFPPPGQGGDLGVLYVVAGSPSYVELAFLPVIRHLRSTLGIPNADSNDNNKDRPKWALATEPHLCRGILRPILPYFDYIMTNVTLPGGSANPTLRQDTTRNAPLFDSSFHPDNKLGVGTIEERNDISIRYWGLAVKVNAMVAAPFQTTVYLDIDTIPCRADFPLLLKQELGSADIALAPITNQLLLNTTTTTIGVDHWMSGNDNSTNTHNTACVVLNMESRNTRELLQLYHNEFFDSLIAKRNDQPALGRAMLKLWQANKLHHVDLGNRISCRERTWNATPSWKVQPPTCRGVGNHNCLLIHKIPKSLEQTKGQLQQDTFAAQ